MIYGCSLSSPKPIIVDCPLPAKVLIEPTPIPEFTGKTYRDLAGYTLELKEALQQCNIDKESL